ncbi:MAG TPA: DedA family protein [Syntrophomonadaceae bacterium]|nr:DedA family protein [Syntrophomonadaceae bacterium]
MVGAFITAMSLKIIAFISSFGYWGIGIGMAIESCNIPLPSEVILPFGGYLVFTGQLNFYGAALAGTVGGTIGSLVSYYIGSFGGRAFLERYGNYLGLPHHRLVQADHWFERYGSATIFLTRLLPGIRTFISLPAGAARMNVVHFTVYTFVGSLIWSLFLTYVGLSLGDNWDSIKPWFHRADLLIIMVILLVIACWWLQWRRRKSA